MAIEVAKLEPCAACPWRTSNHGKPHPDGWYTKRNRARLWSRLRRGEPMSCHPTDPSNPVPEGHAKPKRDVVTFECTGAVILQQRELVIFDLMVKDDRSKSFRDYRTERPSGLTRDGAAELISRVMFGGVPLIGSAKTSRPNLNAPVSHEPLGEWMAPDAL